MSKTLPEVTPLEARLLDELKGQSFTRKTVGWLVLRERLREMSGSAKSLREKYPNDKDTLKLAAMCEERAKYLETLADRWHGVVDAEDAKGRK